MTWKQLKQTNKPQDFEGVGTARSKTKKKKIQKNGKQPEKVLENNLHQERKKKKKYKEENLKYSLLSM